MKKWSFLLVIFSISMILGFNSAFAQSTYVINIPTGAASPDAPYFWQNEKDGSTNGKISIVINDYIKWENADTAAHTVTSGTIEDGPDGIFDSGLFNPGADFQFQFKEAGEYEYFCIVHPWMKGLVTVTAGMQVIPKVGAMVGDGKTTFDVQYEFSRVISSAKVDPEQKAITFEIVGKAKSDNHKMTLMLPKALISGPLVIWADGKQIMDHKVTDQGGINKVEIPLTEKSELITIVGTSVVPEFGSVSMIILAIAIMTFVVLTLKTQKLRIPLSYRF